MATDQAGRKRAADYAAERMAQRGWGPAQLADKAGVDQDTVRAFIDGKRWPWPKKRAAMEEALGIGPGVLDAIARGTGDAEPQGDPVERAILSSRLTRANQHTLIGTYYGMLEAQDQQGRGVGGHDRPAAM